MFHLSFDLDMAINFKKLKAQITPYRDNSSGCKGYSFQATEKQKENDIDTIVGAGWSKRRFLKFMVYMIHTYEEYRQEFSG